MNGKQTSFFTQAEASPNDEAGEWGTQTHYDYGFRIYEPGIGRFLSVDPLSRKYPMLTPYHFASNTPIRAVDLDGLEAFFVHGTTSTSGRWTEPLTKAVLRITNNKTIDTGFSWHTTKIRESGKDWYGNDEYDKGLAAKELAEYVLENRIAGEEITLIGHSHGGNVAIQAAKNIFELTNGEKVNLITISTPVYNGNNPENADFENGVNDHIHLYNKKDTVQKGWANAIDNDDAKGAQRVYRNKGKTKNVEIDVSEYYKKKSKHAHSFDFEHPELIDSAIDSGKIPKLSPVEND